MTIKEFMNREHELTIKELEHYRELMYPFKAVAALSWIALLCPHFLNISMKGMF